MRHEGATPPDARVAPLAARQHGVASLTQLKAAGLSPDAIKRRVRAGRLHRVHQGVYAVGHVGLGEKGRWMAAVLACGPGAVLSHRAAGALWKIMASPPQQSDVTVPAIAGRKRRAGIRLHRSITLLPSHCTLRDAIPVTRPARTLDDLHGVLSAKEFAAALREAEYLGLPIGERLRPDGTRSELEARFLALCGRRHLPRPEVNVRLGAFTVDFFWRDVRLVVEVDGWESHRTRSAFEADRARDAQLKSDGYQVLRFAHRQIERDPGGVVATLRRALA
jgi:very-short-patch-repair endonuclease